MQGSILQTKADYRRHLMPLTPDQDQVANNCKLHWVDLLIRSHFYVLLDESGFPAEP
jgi:hypothetical protein